MWRPIAIAIAVAMTGLCALMLRQDAMGQNGGAQVQSEYTATSNPYLPIRRLEPVW